MTTWVNLVLKLGSLEFFSLKEGELNQTAKDLPGVYWRDKDHSPNGPFSSLYEAGTHYAKTKEDSKLYPYKKPQPPLPIKTEGTVIEVDFRTKKRKAL